MSFGTYVKQMTGVVLTSSLALGLLLGIAVLISGDFEVGLDADLEIGRFEGLWLVVGLPILSILVFVVLSPLSFLLSRLLSRREHDQKQPPQA